MNPSNLPRWCHTWKGTLVLGAIVFAACWFVFVFVIEGARSFNQARAEKDAKAAELRAKVTIDLTIDQKPKSDRRTGVVSVTEAVVNGRYKTIFITAEHDGHLFIVNGRTTIHHPNCPCYGQPIKP